MEALAESTADNFLDFAANYDSSKQSFVTTTNNTHASMFGSSTNIKMPLPSSYVRHVGKKSLPAQHPPNVMGGGSHTLDPKDYNKSHALTDTFTGLIDAFTGELIQGTREYVLTGEVYEGPFQNGKRHGNGAIVKNVYLPYKSFTSLPQVTKGARFFGTYCEDYPIHGTLVVPSLFTYQGPLVDSRPHGQNGTLIKPTGYKYEGNFRDGLYHGYGVEVEPGGGKYVGYFSNGFRQGVGEYSIERKLLPGTASLNYDKLENSSNFCGRKLKYHYKGQWMGNQKQGEGEEILVQREVYRGQFHANERHGYGSITFESKVTDFDHKINGSVEDEDSEIKVKSSEDHISPEGKDQNNQIDEECSTQCTEMSESSNTIGHVTRTPIIAEGEFRAGHPLCGTNGWTLLYANGDCYIGYATNFKPQGYGVMRFANGDCYAGQWEDGRRNGEGCFISGNGKEEYIGEWDEDRIVPFNEGLRTEKIEKLTDMAIALLQTADDDPHIPDDLYGDLGKGETPYKNQRELLETIVQNSLSKSIARMSQCKNTEDEERLPLTTPPKILDDKYIPPKVTPMKRSGSKRKTKARKIETIETESLVDTVSRILFEDNPASDLQVDRSLDSVEVASPPKTKLKTYSNGDTYLGSHNEDGNREGYGVYVSNASGSTYSGFFENNVKQGHGILIHPLGKYVGNFVNDAKEGEGTLIFNDASSYNGVFKKNKFHGKGTFCTKDGTTYVGDWYRGRKNGRGSETLSDGRLYVGRFQDGFRSGTGTLYTEAGGSIIYRGSWLNGLFHGEGLCIERKYQDLTIEYEGEFFNGHRHGYGTLKNSNEDGVICKGYWHRDEPMNGKWRITWPDSRVYSGEVKVVEEELGNVTKKEVWTTFPESDVPPMPLNFEIVTPLPHGFGAMRYENGDIHIGNFEDGVRKGHGSFFVNGEQIQGNWNGDQIIVPTNDNDSVP